MKDMELWGRLFRHLVLNVGGTYLVTNGLMTKDGLETLSGQLQVALGALGPVISTCWSLWRGWKAKQANVQAVEIKQCECAIATPASEPMTLTAPKPPEQAGCIHPSLLFVTGMLVLGISGCASYKHTDPQGGTTSFHAFLMWGNATKVSSITTSTNYSRKVALGSIAGGTETEKLAPLIEAVAAGVAKGLKTSQGVP